MAVERPMTQDHYSILGVPPNAGQTEIRAAYRALMRIYHPDADPSAEAAERARSINVAYAVLSNPEKRAGYDGAVTGRRSVHFEPDPREGVRPRRSWLGPIAAIGVASVAAGMIAFAISPPLERPFEEQVEVAPRQVPAAKLASKPEGACGEPQVSALIQKELFARAARQQPELASQLRQVEGLAVTRFAAQDETGSRCAGWLSLDIPPNVAVEGGRTNLNADVAFDLAKTDGTLRLSGLSGATRLVRSLATIGPPPKVEAPERGLTLAKVPADQSLKPASLPKRTTEENTAVSQKPASPCQSIAARADRLVCESGNLRSLDRQLAGFYRQSWDRADERKRGVLLGSRKRFDDRRNACPTDDCTTAAYVARLREISDIMAGKTAP